MSNNEKAQSLNTIKTKTLTFVDASDVLSLKHEDALLESDFTFGDLDFGLISKYTFLDVIDDLIDQESIELDYNNSTDQDEIDRIREDFLDRLAMSLADVEWVNIEAQINIPYDQDKI